MPWLERRRPGGVPAAPSRRSAEATSRGRERGRSWSRRSSRASPPPGGGPPGASRPDATRVPALRTTMLPSSGRRPAEGELGTHRRRHRLLVQTTRRRIGHAGVLSERELEPPARFGGAMVRTLPRPRLPCRPGWPARGRAGGATRDCRPRRAGRRPRPWRAARFGDGSSGGASTIMMSAEAVSAVSTARMAGELSSCVGFGGSVPADRTTREPVPTAGGRRRAAGVR